MPKSNFDDLFGNNNLLGNLLSGVAEDFFPGQYTYTSTETKIKNDPKEPKYKRADELTLGMTLVKPDGSTAVIDNLGRVNDDYGSIEIVVSDGDVYELWPNTKVEVK